MGYYNQPKEMQVDLMAYRDVIMDQRDDVRLQLLYPKTAADDIRFGIKTKKFKLPKQRGQQGPTGSKEDTIRQQLSSPEAGIKQMRADMIKDGADPAKVDMMLADMRTK